MWALEENSLDGLKTRDSWEKEVMFAAGAVLM
jgi:hypothetical protein